MLIANFMVMPCLLLTPNTTSDLRETKWVLIYDEPLKKFMDPEVESEDQTMGYGLMVNHFKK